MPSTPKVDPRIPLIETLFNRTQTDVRGNKLGEAFSEDQKAQAAKLLAIGWTPGMVVSSMANSRMADKQSAEKSAGTFNLGPAANVQGSAAFPSSALPTASGAAPTPANSLGPQKSMPVSTINGWTGAGLLPSYAITSQILGQSGSAPQSAPAAATAPAPAGAPSPAPVGAPLPSVPAIVPPGWNSGSSAGVGGGGLPGRGGIVNPSLTPDQAYAAYLQQRAFADTSTPASEANKQVMYAQQQLNYVDPFGPNRNGLTVDPYAQTLRTNLQQQILNFQKASPYAYSYNTPAAFAPAPQPMGGYATGYGQAPPGGVPAGWTSGGFGGSNMAGSGFGF